jgi:hypothetical protein
VTEDAVTLYETWIGMGGEGIVLKDPASLYRCASVGRLLGRDAQWIAAASVVFELELVLPRSSPTPVAYATAFA